MASQNAGPAFIGESARSQFFSNANSPTWLAGNNSNLYVFQLKIQSGGGNIDGAGVFKSADGGFTWAEADAADSPLSATGDPFWDVPNKVLICGLVTSTFPDSAQPIFLQNFNLQTETWGAPYATGGPNAVANVQWCFKRPDGSVVLIYDIGSSHPGGTTRLRAAVFATGSWSASIDVGVAILPFDASGNVLVGGTAATMDATGTIHIIFGNNSATQFMYQAFQPDNSLGSSHHFAGISQSGNTLGNIAISGNSLYVPYITNTRTNNTVQIGTPLTAPVWSVVTPAPLAYPANTLNQPGNILANAGTLYWFLNFKDPATATYPAYQIATSTDGGLTWAIIADDVPKPYFYDFEPGQSPIAPNADPTFGGLNPTFAMLVSGATVTVYGFDNIRNTSKGIFEGYFLNSATFAPPVTPAIKITFRGVKRTTCDPEQPVSQLPPVPHVKRAM